MNDHGLVALSLHQRTAALDARERLLALARDAQGPDRVLLATCHRVELYLALGGSADPREWAARELGLPIHDPLWGSIGLLRGANAAEHLLRVAAGLDSVVLGEAQISGQLRQSLDAAAGTVDPLLRTLFERALYVARSLRRTTGLGSVSRSVGSLAVDDLMRRLPDPASARVLVVGAGEMGALAVRALSLKVGETVVANRDRARAHTLAESANARAVGLDRVPAEIATADAVVSAADTRGAVLTHALLARRVSERPLVLIDIAVPRSVAESARDLDGLQYRTVDDLVDETAEVSPADLERASRRCADEAGTLMRRWTEREANDTIREMRAHAEELRRRQVERALRRLGHLGERDRSVVEGLSVSLTNALLHETTVSLKARHPK